MAKQDMKELGFGTEADAEGRQGESKNERIED